MRYSIDFSAEIDAPRHLFLHTKKSIQRLAEDAGFKIESISYDSRSWQLWGSEQYSKDIALLDDNSYYVNPAKSIFSSQMIEDFEKSTIEINKSVEGDQAEFYLWKVKQL